MKNIAWLILTPFLAGALPAYAQTAPPLPVPTVISESEVFTLTPPNNGSGPLWSFGCTQVARLGEQVFVSAMETGPDAPLLCNTRWRLLRLEGAEWKPVAQDGPYRQREPCPIAVMPPNQIVLNVNDSLELPGIKYGRALPLLRVFTLTDAGAESRVVQPDWTGAPYFTDHSYRGFAADPGRGRVFMLNIDAKTSVQNACLLSMDGETLAGGTITFPIRSCYPQAALVDFAAHVLAIGDIVEPVEAWRQYKFEQTQQAWDYVFRRLFYTSTADLRSAPFAAPLEIDSVDGTAGAITNQDLWIGPDGEAWILYTRCEVQNALMRDKFFPDKSILPALCLARVRDGAISRKDVLVPENPEASVSQAKFHVTPEGALYVALHVTGVNGGVKLLRLLPDDASRTLTAIPLAHPLGAFCLAGVRAGNAPSTMIDLFGTEGNDIYRYAAVRLDPAP